MSSILGLGGSSSTPAFYNQLLNQSLRFDTDQEAYLSKGFAAAGNKKKWTWSGWVKKNTAQITTETPYLWYAGNYSSVETGLYFYTGTGTNSDRIQFEHYDSSGVSTIHYQIRSTAKFRDTTAWYHIVAVWDTGNSTEADRMRLYVNGQRITDLAANAYPTLNYDSIINSEASAYQHNIGRRGTNYANMYLAEVYFIDDEALTADSFGETKNGIWIPKVYTGSYNQNGFKLNFQDDTTVEGFNTVIWTATGTEQFLRTGFDPDFVWYKRRNANGTDHYLIDSLRGVGGGSHALNTNNDEAEGGGGNADALGTNGFTINAGSSGETYAAWAWKAGGKPSATNSAGQGAVPTAGSVKIDGANSSANLQGTIPATKLSANTTRGFSVVTYTGTGSNATVAHGLGAAPKWIIIKALTEPTGGVHFGDDQGNWLVYHAGTDASAPEDKYLLLNKTSAIGDSAVAFNDTAPTNDVFSIGTVVDANESGDNYVAYCWSEISGYSKFGSYIGNGNPTGPTVTTGFKVAFLMIKRTDATEDWHIYDNTRDTYNPVTNVLVPNLGDQEANYASGNVEFTSDGFKLINTGGAYNATDGEYIYMAFADTRDAAFWLDQSGNANHFNHSAIEHTDVMPDSPTNNRPTFNFLLKDLRNSTTLSNGNKTMELIGANDTYAGLPITIYRDEGQAYCEVEVDAVYNGNSGDAHTVFVIGDNKDVSDIGSGDSSNYEGSYNAGGSGDAAASINNSGVNQGQPTKFRTAGDRVGVYIDYDNGKGWFALNGTVQTVNGTPDIANGTNPHFTFTANSRLTVGVGGIHGSSSAPKFTLKDHPDDWKYTPPSDYTAFATAELPDPAIDPNASETPQDYFGTLTWTGDGNSSRSIVDSEASVSGVVNFTPDLVWIKDRIAANNHVWVDSVRGVSNLIFSNSSVANVSGATQVSSFNDGGFTNGATQTYVNENGSSNAYVAWNWKAGGATPAQTYEVKVVDDSGNKYRFDDFGTSAATLYLQEGGTYTFDQSDSSNDGHPLRFSTTSNGSHGGGSEYTTGVTTSGTPGTAGAYTRITVAASAPTLYYYCTAHSGMGGEARTNSTYGSSNFKGSVAATVSASVKSGFSIVNYVATGSGDITVGHGLDVAPDMIIGKVKNQAYGWSILHVPVGVTGTLGFVTNALGTGVDNVAFGKTAPTSTVFTAGRGSTDNMNYGSGDDVMAYCFASKDGFSKAGTYIGHHPGSATFDGQFVYTGFRPAWVLVKSAVGGTGGWNIYDNKRQTFNPNQQFLQAQSTAIENTTGGSTVAIDFLANGFKAKSTHVNVADRTYVYLAFAEQPFKYANAV